MCPHQMCAPNNPSVLLCMSWDTSSAISVPGQSGKGTEDMENHILLLTCSYQSVENCGWTTAGLLMEIEPFRRTASSGKTLRNWKSLEYFLMCKDRERGSELCPVLKPPLWDHSSYAMSTWASHRWFFPRFLLWVRELSTAEFPSPKTSALPPWGREMKAEKEKDGYRRHQCF